MREKSSSHSTRARLLLGVLLLSCPVTLKAQEQMPVTVVVARQSTVTEQVSVIGSVVSREEVQVHSFIEGQEIRQILVEVGQYVEKGQPLAVLDTTDARMRLDRNAVSMLRATAAVAVEAARVDVARVTEAETASVFERSRVLHARNVISQQVLDQHRNAHERAAAELGLARQSLALAEAEAALVTRERAEIELTVERSTVRAPMAGLILSRTARLGAMTSDTATPLFLIAEEGSMEFVASVVETNFVCLQNGMRADVTLPGHEDPVSGTLRLKAAQLDPATRSGQVHIALDRREGLTPGVFAQGRIDVSERQNILLPGSAVKTVRGADTIFVVTEGAVDVRPVTVGARQDGLVEITQGVDDGEMVVLKAGGFLKAQDRVQPVVATLDAAPVDRLAASLPSVDETREIR
ncbi:efflux RND transporter periplasmic adaptor subunit [Shinella sp.]|uniref:efflux RND transporter periplasmic adaptor subunit n=1 Tax=Shinella sp. TaxID=1870904 RepID=UPI003F71A69B